MHVHSRKSDLLVKCVCGIHLWDTLNIFLSVVPHNIAMQTRLHSDTHQSEIFGGLLA